MRYNQIMSRPRTIPDDVIFSAIMRQIEDGGDRAVAFSSVSAATGLSAPSLVQRYGGLAEMIRAALTGEWNRIEAQTSQAIAGVTDAAKGPQALFKALSPGPSAALLAASLRDTSLSEAAHRWRARVEAALTVQCGDPERAAMLFALWSGQMLWGSRGDKGFKLKDAIKRLG